MQLPRREGDLVLGQQGQDAPVKGRREDADPATVAHLKREISSTPEA